MEKEKKTNIAHAHMEKFLSYFMSCKMLQNYWYTLQGNDNPPRKPQFEHILEECRCLHITLIEVDEFCKNRSKSGKDTISVCFQVRNKHAISVNQEIRAFAKGCNIDNNAALKKSFWQSRASFGQFVTLPWGWTCIQPRYLIHYLLEKQIVKTYIDIFGTWFSTERRPPPGN